MKIKNLLRLIMMILGIWLLLFSVGQFSSFFFSLKLQGSEAFTGNNFISLVYYLAVTYVLLFHSDRVLRLIKASPELLEAEVSFKQADLRLIVQAILIVAGLWLILFNISATLTGIFWLIRESNAADAQIDMSSSIRYLIADIISIFIGVGVIFNYQGFANWIVKKGQTDSFE